LGNKPLYEFNEDERGTIRLCVGVAGKEQYKLETRTNSWKAFTWYHLVATFDGTDVKLYVNGTLEDSANQPGVHYASSKVCFGSKYNGESPFRGRLDDIRIYSHALTADEITGLYRVYPHTLLSAVAEAEGIIQQNPKEAIVLLEKKITELEKWREENPNRNQLHAQRISFDLHLELAKAKKAAGFPSEDVDAAYDRLIELGIRYLSIERTRPERMVGQSEPLARAVRHIFKDCEAKNDWPGAQRLLDTLFARVKNPGAWAIFVESCLDDKTNRWAQEYSKYLEGKPRLKFDRDRLVARTALVAHWKLDETSGTTARDSSGNWHSGTLRGDLSFNSNSVEGVIGRALHLTGAEHMSIRADSVSLPTSAFTICLWFNPDSDQDSSGNKWYLMYWGGDEETLGNKPLYEFNEDEKGTIRLCVGVAGKEQYKLETRTNSWKAFTWYHLVATFDGAEVKLYVDGTLEDAANQRGTHYASSKVCFGSRYDGDGPFKGKLDDIRIYSRSLTADEIGQLHMLRLRMPPAFRGTLENAKATLNEQGPKEAIVFLEEKIAGIEQWIEENPDRYVLGARELVLKLLLQLAAAREAAGLPSKDVDSTYDRAIELGIRHSSNEGLTAEGMVGQHEPLARLVRNICRDCEAKNNWPRAQRLLDTLFAAVKYPGAWAIFVESCLDDKSSEWAKKFSEYFDNDLRLKVERDRTLAERYVAAEKYLEAAQLYQIIVDSGYSGDDKRLFEFELCKNLFLAGKYRNAIPRLETFVANNNTDIARSQVIRAMVMKFQCHTKLSEFDKAASACFDLMMDYPEAEEMPEVIFCMGYCHMLLRNFEQAADALNLVVQDYPESTYASKARTYLTRVKSMTE
jgi:tetratricopeptide (TPR) repeat protein